VIPGLFAAGECACVSVHGANRLGTNSLVDLVVFGRRGGQQIARYCQDADFVDLPDAPAQEVEAELARLRSADGQTRTAELRKAMQDLMSKHVGVFRTAEGMQKAVDGIRELKERYRTDLKIDDRGQIFNHDLLEAWELGSLLDIAEVTAVSALARIESRGGHSREDFPKRNDADWLKHTIATLKDGHIALTYKDVVLGRYQPKERVY
jgi:succinate dehydrogenase / fumarate reductase flavoprotein subunit